MPTDPPPYYTTSEIDAKLKAVTDRLTALETAPPPLVTTKGIYSSSPYLTTPIPTFPKIDPNSAAVVAQLNTGNRVLISTAFGSPIYKATASTPRTTVVVDNDPAWGPCDITGKSIPIDPAWTTTEGSDHKMTIIDGNTVYDLTGAVKEGDVWHTYWGGVYTLNGTGVSTTVASKPTGAGFSSVAGIVTLTDIRAKVIDHALVFASDKCAPANQFRFPAMTSDGLGNGIIVEGMRFQLDPAYTVPTSWPVGVQMVAKAMQKYGFYCIDNSGGGQAFGRQLATQYDGVDPYPSVGFSSGYDILGGVSGQTTYIPFSRCRVLAKWDGT